jgi:hypothetical protein
MSMANELVPAQETSGRELAVASQQAMAEKEIEAAIIVANRFPRDEDRAYGAVLKSCGRFTFASLACYSFPRGGQQIEGPSVNLAREMARCWGNCRFGFDIVYDDETTRTVRGWAWDVQTNARASQDATFAKLIYRRKGGWVKPDERDLRELTNKHGAICERNALLHLMPPDLVEDAIRQSKETLANDAAKDPDEARKRLIKAFGVIGVPVEELERHLGHPLKQISPQEMADLRGVWKSISDGNSTWAEYCPPEAKQPTQTEGGATMEDLTKPHGDKAKDTKSAKGKQTGASKGAKGTPDYDGYAQSIREASDMEEIGGLLVEARDFLTEEECGRLEGVAKERADELGNGTQ